jgi:eukaryotic-like serine/threonine-protein kinase
VVLYELLAAQHPSGLQPGASLVEYLRAAVEPQAVPPSQRCSDTATARALRGDLDTIVMKALRAEPAERYASVAALADDLQRWLGLRPIAARRESRAYVLRRWAQRNRALAAVGSLGVLALAFGAVGTATQAGRAEREAAQALAQGRAAQAAAAESERQRVLAEQRRGEAEAQRSEAQAQRRDALSARETAQLEAQRAADASTVAARERRRADERAAEAEAQRDAALRELDRADAASQFVVYLLGGFGNKSYTTAELLKTAQQMIERQYADDAKQRAQLLLLVSTLYGSAQQPNASLPLLEQAAAAARTANDAALSAGITCLEGTMHHQLGNNGRAEAVLGQGIDRARGAGSRADSTLAGCFAARAQARAASGNVAGAEDDAKAGLALLKAPRSGDRLVQLNLNGTLARVYAVQARYGDSIAAQRRTVEGWRAIGRLDTPEGVSVRSNLAAALNNGGLTREALDILLELQAMADPAGQPRGPVSMINMGTMYSVIGFNDEAVAWAERGTQAAQAQGSPMGLAQAAGRAATVMCRAGRYARCAELVAMARGPLDTLPAQDPGRSLTAFAESQLALQAGRHDEALAALEPSIAFDEATQRFKVSLASGCVAAARIERARGRHAQAHAWLDRAQQAAAAVEATVPHTVHMGNVHLERARLLAAEGRTADSARAATAALRHFEVGAGSDAPVTLEARQLVAAR